MTQKILVILIVKTLEKRIENLEQEINERSGALKESKNK